LTLVIEESSIWRKCLRFIALTESLSACACAMSYIFTCPACSRKHTNSEYEESKFCQDCGKFLSSRYKVRVQPKSAGARRLGVHAKREHKRIGKPRHISLLIVYVFTNFIICSILFGIVATILIVIFAGFVTLVGVPVKSGYTAYRRTRTWTRRDGTVYQARKSSWEVSPEELPPNTYRNIFALIYSICTIPLLLVWSIFTLPVLLIPLFVVHLYNKRARL
jgi:hypothetical protein